MSMQTTNRPKADVVKVWFFRFEDDLRIIARDEYGNPFVAYDAETAGEMAAEGDLVAVETDMRQLLEEKERNDDIRRYLNSPKFNGLLGDTHNHPYVHRNDILSILNSY